MAGRGRGAVFQVALIGAGRMGALHGRNLAAHRRLALACIVDPRPEAAQSLAAELGAQTASLEAALSDAAIGAVLIASSTDTHLEIALAALAAGKQVFCEKPLDLDLGRLRAHAGALETSRLFVAFNRRFDPQFRALKAQLEAGSIGALESLNIISHDPTAPPPGFVETSGGLFRDMTIHDFDIAGWLLDEPPSEVFAFASNLVDPAIGAAGDVDTARIVLRNTAGQLCAISNTRRSGYGYDQRIEAFGSQGALAVGNPRLSTLQTWDEGGARAAAIHPSFQSRYAASYRAELDHFAEVLAGTSTPSTGYEASVRALALAEAALRSSASGRSERV
ncbi:MAG TPA: inositol 2-dehydrogenase [Caulobacteraceae bacterium]|nr:inositol 2-dehydrogenase [Caulobacteraceae bacterium]